MWILVSKIMGEHMQLLTMTLDPNNIDKEIP